MYPTVVQYGLCCVIERGLAGAEGAEGAMATCCVRVLRRLRLAAPELAPDSFVSTRLTNKLHQQLQEPLTLAAAATPLWYPHLHLSLQQPLSAHIRRTDFYRVGVKFSLSLQYCCFAHFSPSVVSGRRSLFKREVLTTLFRHDIGFLSRFSSLLVVFYETR